MNLSCDINEKEVEVMKQMMKDLGMKDNSLSGLLDVSLNLLAWLIEEKKKGNKILSANYDDEVSVELEHPYFDNIPQPLKKAA